MIIKKIKKIIIFGGGTSGWLTAAYLSTNLKVKTEILLIENPEYQPIGVGEGTQPFTSTFLSNCGIDPKTWMKPSKASFKFGVELSGWNDQPYFVDNDHFLNHIVFDDLYAHDYFIDKSKEQYFEWLPAYRLAKQNKSPKMGRFDVNTGPGLMTFGAVHFSAPDIIQTLKNICKNRVQHLETRIVSIKSDNHGITGLIDEEGSNYFADLFIDCTGFSCQLAEKTLGIEFYPFEKTLPCNKAVAIPTEYNNPREQCVPYTKSIAMNAGWRWEIPIFTRIGNGYVYSDKFISPDEAEKELRESINEWKTPAKHIQMKCGRLKIIADKNVCAVGLSAGFVEPLEATGITFTTKIVEWLTILLNQNMNVWNENIRNTLNYHFDLMSLEIHAFVWSHYHFSTKSDTEFWKQIRNTKNIDIPKSIRDILQHVLPFPSGPFYITPDSMFHQGHWFSVLHSGNFYKSVKQNQSVEEIEYLKYFIDNQKNRIDQAIRTFPNHYDFLSNWYNEE